ncbi:BatA domain-containing protein [Chitinophaga solisilvae]|uniref:BatA domain-containing protein n=1 Tax=Chitinophaga solisilvae TaxID=1233460 RepID=UPI0021D2D81A|nr:BatA domain-containing protein [Chitinophaga solisilvae]
MLQLLTPIWMLLSAGIIVPVIIHLWNRRPARILRVGSISLITATAVRHSRSWRVSDWWLLLLRCLLILLLALLLAEPVWRQPLASRHQKGWVIVEPAVYNIFQPQVDSLLQQGFQLRTWDTGFRHCRKEELFAPPADSAPPPYWTLLRKLATKVPADFSIYLFTGNQLRRFQGERPALALNLRWYMAPATDTLLQWNAVSYPLAGDSTRILYGRSSPDAIFFIPRDTLTTDTAGLRFTVYTDRFPDDARYLQAALLAIQQYTGRKIKIVTVTNVAQLPAQQDWLWWLSEQPVPAAVKAGHILKYATGNPQTNNGYITGTDIRIFKSIQAPDSIPAIWRDGYGKPVLSADYTLYTRFHPAWSDLVWQESFPQQLLQLIFPVVTDPAHDLRRIDPAQAQPATGKSRHTAGSMEDIPLDKACWLLFMLVFCLERYLSLRKKVTRDA